MLPTNQIETGRLIYSVSRITREIKSVLEGAFPQVWVEGEVSGFKLDTSGHMYFNLKDAEAVLSCNFFRNSNQGLKFQLKDGLKVLCCGKVSFYGKNGRLSLYVEKVEPKGVGELQLAFQQLKEQLQKEGLFDESHKVPIPVLPSRIGIVTSLTGAVVRDILNILRRRFYGIGILVYPVKVQGEGAAGEIAQAIEDLNRLKCVDVMILARGGGSLEDLWAFNEEIVARAIYASGIPVISAVGHEVDFTIADFVADLRAPTPSAAAELVISRKEELADKLNSLIKALRISLDNSVSLYESRLADLLESRALKFPLDIVERDEEEVKDLKKGLEISFAHTLDICGGRLEALLGKLDALSPLSILGRGYSITLLMPEKEILRDVRGVKKGDIIETVLADGRITGEVRNIVKEEKR